MGSGSRCNQKLTFDGLAIREEIHEQIDYKPASFEVIENVTFVSGCHKGCDEKIVSSNKPPQMAEKGLPGPGLLAHVIVGKYCDHIPLHRMEGRPFDYRPDPLPL